jgi:hypothetical protein
MKDNRFNKHLPAKSKKTELLDAQTILVRTHESSFSFLDIFETQRKKRKAQGTPTDEEQDLLRAMLLFTAAGLDSMIKQLIEDALPSIIENDCEARQVLINFIEKKLIQDDRLNVQLITRALSERNPREALTNELIEDLTSRSLQSKDELLRAASFFAIQPALLSSDLKLLKEIFEARNQIVHEMDVDFSQGNRCRRSRKKTTMIRYTEELLCVSKNFFIEASKRLEKT